MFTESKFLTSANTTIMADSGYQGINTHHANGVISRKNTKLHPLTRVDKQFNHQLNSRRIFVEHVIGKVKIFKIVSDRYRNRRRRFSLRFNLIAGLYNYELASSGVDF